MAQAEEQRGGGLIMACYYPEHLEAERDKIFAEYFSQFAEDEEIDESDMSAYYNAHASEELKEFERQSAAERAKKPPGLH